MGICFSAARKKKKKPLSSSSSSSSPPPQPSAIAEEAPRSPPQAPPAAVATPTTIPNSEQPKDPSPPSHTQKPQDFKPKESPSKKPLFLITPSKAKKPNSQEAPRLSSSMSVAEVVSCPTLHDDAPVMAPTRTSSCTKEEVESILIQCGRLSRSSSGNADRNGRRFSGLDHDHEKRGEEGEEWERSLHHSSSSRPSPRRRAHSRERDNGGRRVSRSPGRRTEQPVASGGERQQPGKMVSLPAREKSSDNNGSSRRAGESDARRTQWSGGRGSNAPVRSSSPRSRSPGIARVVVANENNSHLHGGRQTLSRSSSRKGEQSPYKRRNPMAEIDDNSLREAQMGTKMVQREAPNTPSKVAREKKLLSCRKEIREEEHNPLQPPMDGKPLGITRSRSSRRSSRDLDAILTDPPAACSYASVLLEKYHEQSNGGAQYSLPACVSKACSILEAVADLKNDSYSSSGQMGSKGSSFVEPKLEQSSLQKFVSVMVADTELQESAGSNSFVGQQQSGAGSCDGSAVELSSDRCRTTSWSAQQEEEVEDVGRRPCDGQKRGGGGGNSGRRKELENQRRVRRGMSSGGGRAYSAPVGAIAASTS